MPTDNTQKNMLGALIIIGIIIIIILIAPRATSSRYAYQGNAFTASALPVEFNSAPQTGTFSFVRYIPHKTQTYTSTGTTYTYYTQPQTQYYDYSYQYQGGVVFPDGCTLTSPVSTTTGQPCS